MIETILTWLASLVLNIILKIGYIGITLLMTIESSFIPFPSEIVIPPAAYLAQQGKMNVFLVIISGIIGSLLGALINYYIAYTLGRKVICSFINKQKIDKAENYFLEYGNASTLLGRFVPGIRQLISIPAGFSRMSLKSFILYTSIGSGIWVIILTILGYVFGANQELLVQYYKQISWFFVVVALVFIIILIIKKKNHEEKTNHC